jgi:hypothetical protein
MRRTSTIETVTIIEKCINILLPNCRKSIKLATPKGLNLKNFQILINVKKNEQGTCYLVSFLQMPHYNIQQLIKQI